jgi:hypothetical protein
MGNFLLKSWKFLHRHFTDIMLVVLLLLVFNYYVTYPGLNITGSKSPILETTVVSMENMNNMDEHNSDSYKLHQDMKKNGFCKTHTGKIHDLNKNCKRLTNDNCKNTSCCVLVHDLNRNDDVCLAGGIGGPTFLTDKGKELDFDNYIFDNKCYGQDCPK